MKVKVSLSMLPSAALTGSVILGSCSSNPVGPVLPESICGWAVGGFSLDGYALILHSLDGGNNWERQGNAASLPDVGLDAVRAVDSLHAWAVGEASDGYATILTTSDTGATWTPRPHGPLEWARFLAYWSP